MRAIHRRSKIKDASLVDLNLSSCDELSKLHNICFSNNWSAGDFQNLLVQESVFGFGLKSATDLSGFILIRLAADEAEVLSIGVNPHSQNMGAGWRLMQASFTEISKRGAQCLFLEVDENNLAAVALYKKLGFYQVGERKAYYKNEQAKFSSALVLRLDLF